MQLIRHLHSLPAGLTGTALAIGNFDGLHQGHRAVLAETVRTARALGVPAGVLTFAPHPRAFFTPEAAPLSIYPLHEKCRLLREAGVEALYLLRFDARLAALGAQAFLETLLAGTLRVKHVVTGENFVFGHKRGGDVAMLRAAAAQLGFGYTPVAGVVCENGEPCSSSRIRAHLRAGEMAAASRLLGRPYTLAGRVQHGDARGRQLGFPTANVALHGIFLPARGVYAVRVTLPDGTQCGGVANLGTRPTVGGQGVLLETHCFDVAGDLYGRQLRVQPLHYLRPEMRFEGLEALTRQITQDAGQARALLSERKPA